MGCVVTSIGIQKEGKSRGVPNFLIQTYEGVGGGPSLGTFQKKMKKGCVGNTWGWRYAMLMLMGGVEEGSQGGPKTAT